MTKIAASFTFVLALTSAACAELEVPEGAAGGAADEVAVASAELGSWSKRYQSVHYGFERSLTSEYMVIAPGSGCSRVVEVILTQNATAIPAPLLPDVAGCEYVTATHGSQGRVFVGDSNLKRIWRLRHDEGGTFWTQVTTTPGTLIQTIRHDGTNVYWDDTLGVHKAPILGGAITTLAGVNHRLIDRDGSNLYIQRYNVSDDNYTLLRQPTAGGAPTTLRTMSDTFTGGFAFNSTHIYFEQTKTNDWSRIYKMAKNPGGVAVFAEVDPTVDWIHSVAASEAHVYWLQGTENTLHRRRISDSDDANLECPDQWCEGLILTANYVFVMAFDFSGSDTLALWRGQL
jgi:hypothetical protein